MIGRFANANSEHYHAHSLSVVNNIFTCTGEVWGPNVSKCHYHYCSFSVYNIERLTYKQHI